jgi:hypothetical protein
MGYFLLIFVTNINLYLKNIIMIHHIAVIILFSLGLIMSMFELIKDFKKEKGILKKISIERDVLLLILFICLLEKILT